MIEIMSHFHQYVPVIEGSKQVYVADIDETVSVPEASLYKLLLGGDQLTVARARSAMKIRMNSPSPVKRLAGFIPVVEDWYTQTILMEVCMCNNKLILYSTFTGYMEVLLFKYISRRPWEFISVA